MLGISPKKLIELGRSQPQVPFYFYGPVAVVYLAVAVRSGISPGKIGALFLAGLFSWTLGEYFLHRFSFHMDLKVARVNFLAAAIHQFHHREPGDANYVAAPTLLGLPFYLAGFGTIGHFTGAWGVVGAVLSGFGVGYLFYEWVHSMTHLGKPKLRVWKNLKKHHMLHHFADHHNYFGVSSPFWDHVMGTYPKKSSETAPGARL